MPNGANQVVPTNIPTASVGPEWCGGTNRSSLSGRYSIEPGTEAMVNGGLEMHAGTSITAPFGLVNMVSHISELAVVAMCVSDKTLTSLIRVVDGCSAASHLKRTQVGPDGGM